jgi:hypothetical protein
VQAGNKDKNYHEVDDEILLPTAENDGVKQSRVLASYWNYSILKSFFNRVLMKRLAPRIVRRMASKFERKMHIFPRTRGRRTNCQTRVKQRG